MSVFGNRRVGFQTDPSKAACKHRRHCSSNSPMASHSSLSIITQCGPDQ